MRVVGSTRSRSGVDEQGFKILLVQGDDRHDTHTQAHTRYLKYTTSVPNYFMCIEFFIITSKLIGSPRGGGRGSAYSL